MNVENNKSSDKIMEELNNKILKERARILSETPKEVKYDTIELLKFTLEDETYAFETSEVREIYKVTEITPLPSVPEFLEGIINVRGEILSVISIKQFFNLEKTETGKIKNIIILQNNNRALGILADDTMGVFNIPRDNIQSSLPTLDSSGDKYLKGITQDRIIILSAKNILNDKTLIIDEEI